MYFYDIMFFMSKLPVVAAVPNYNMGENLKSLIPALLNQEYAAVYVLDDASTDNSIDIVKSYGTDVNLIRGQENIGAGSNRNRIIGHVESAILHFIDADMELKTPDTPNVASDRFSYYQDQGVGVMGGLVSRKDSSQEPYNYGPRFCLKTNTTAGLPLIIDRLKDKPYTAVAARRLGQAIMKDWPNVLSHPTATKAFWVHEGNMFIPADLFNKIGGYDPKLRAHETQDLSLRLEQKGIKRQFDPSVEVVHHYIDVRGNQRNNEQLKAMAYLIHKHGILNWINPKLAQS